MSLLSSLNDPGAWQEFFLYKRSGGHLSREEEQALEDFVRTAAYRPLAEHILQGGCFAPPQKRLLSKLHTAKKRVVYTYSDDENRLLKLLTFLLQRKYDRLFAPNLYSFRPHKGVRDAVRTLTGHPDIGAMWSYKTDISNYFNSVPVSRLLPLLTQALWDEPDTCRFLTGLLTDPRVYDRGTLLREEKGIMAGTPISTFLANLYLSHLDHHFRQAGVLYARYSDDMILFAPTRSELEGHVDFLLRELERCGLQVNPAKEERSAPGQMWSFLGICYRQGVVDVSPVSVTKLKAKMRRKARALARWRARKGLDGIHAARAFVRSFQKKLFENPVDNELTWARWYFPLINTTASLTQIDRYAHSCIRYLATGKHTKAAYNFRYADIKALGYTGLTASYYAPAPSPYPPPKPPPGQVPAFSGTPHPPTDLSKTKRTAAPSE